MVGRELELTIVNDDAVLRVVRGSPTDDELAALVAVLSVRARGARPATTPRSSTWAAYWNSQPDRVTPGVGAWRASALPH